MLTLFLIRNKWRHIITKCANLWRKKNPYIPRPSNSWHFIHSIILFSMFALLQGHTNAYVLIRIFFNDCKFQNIFSWQKGNCLWSISNWLCTRTRKPSLLLWWHLCLRNVSVLHCINSIYSTEPPKPPFPLTRTQLYTQTQWNHTHSLV